MYLGFKLIYIDFRCIQMDLAACGIKIACGSLKTGLAGPVQGLAACGSLKTGAGATAPTFSVDFFDSGWILVDFMYTRVSGIDFEWISSILSVFRWI